MSNGRTYKLHLCGLVGLLLNTQVLAADIEMVGQTEQSIPTAQGKKTIILNTYQLSDHALHLLSTKHSRQKLSHSHRSLSLTDAPMPKAVQLGMNNVPPLDQGQHSTCVTFAVSGAIDASLNRGQYTSPLCLLRLGQYLERTNWIPSGWDGFSAAILLLDRIKLYGIISLENQQRYGCGGVYEYPYRTPVPTGEMSLKTYRQYHEMLMQDKVSWSFLWSVYGALFETDGVKKTKLALSKGNRVLVSVILPRVYVGVAGATGTYHVTEDTWVYSAEIESSFNKKMAGHAMIVTGYDDKAYAVDRQGHIHRGLFTLRNSWGPVADEGNFYMTYDYFDGMVMEAIQIGPGQKPA